MVYKNITTYYKMSRLHFKQLAKLALTICVGSFLVNILYTIYWGPEVKDERRTDLKSYHLENITSLLMIQERQRQPGVGHMSIDSFDYDDIDTERNLISSNSIHLKQNSTIYEEKKFTTDENLKEKFFESHAITTSGASDKVSLFTNATREPSLSDRPSEETRKVIREKPRGDWNERMNSKDVKKDKRNIPINVDNIDDFHEDVLRNEIWHLDEVNPMASGNINYCPDKPPRLIGDLAGIFQDVTKDQLEELYPEMESGGRLRPPDCVPRQRLAVILPYRNRYPHLHITLQNLIPMLKRQQADVTFFVVEQAPPSTFNKGALLNAGFIEANKLGNFDCFILHDVDLIPLNDFNLYRCDSNPRHYAVSIDKYNFQLLFSAHFGGVVGFARSHYLKVNGNSNLYLGWGGEDDDFRLRLVNKNFTIQRYPLQTARYCMIKHTRDRGNEINPLRNAILKSSKARQDIDGLNTVRYKVLNITFERLYTWITVSINNTEILQSVPAVTLVDIKNAKKKWLSDMTLRKKKQQLNNSGNVSSKTPNI
ncbi:Zinc finger protein containing five transmembrane domains [Bulinus truncatus]|nr:Zinc finger protein containing five transmembrane domains [Bulinus truncatus]